MRFLGFICGVVMVVWITPGLAQNATEDEPSTPAAQATVPAPAAVLPPSRVGRLSFVSGGVSVRSSAETAWADAEPNLPIFAGAAVRTDQRGRAEIRIGANTIGLSNGSEIEIADLRDQLTQIALSRGRIGVRLRQAGEGDTVEVDVAQGGVWLLGPGSYDVDTGIGDQPLRVAVFDGAARLAGAGGATGIGGGDMAVRRDADDAAIEPVMPDDFVEWCRERDYDASRLAAPYYISPDMTGFAELDDAGTWKTHPEFGTVWVPTATEEWAPYRFGHWSWIAPWGWSWIDDQSWGFATSHYGRWALIDDHWAWVPGGFVAHPAYMPAVVAFLGTPGVGLSSEDGAAVGWFPLAPGEAYWPSYARDVDYVRGLNGGNVQDTETIRLRADGEPPWEVFNGDFANRQYATVVPRPSFTNGRPVAPARVILPERRLQNAPVLMGSPQIAPPAARRVAGAAPGKPNVAASRMVARISRNGGKPVRTAAAQPRGRAQTVIIRAAHLHAPSYAGQPRGRQAIVLRVAHDSRGAAGKSVRF